MTEGGLIMEKIVKDIMVPVESFPAVTAQSTVKNTVAVLVKALESEPCFHKVVLVVENNTLAGIVGLKELLLAAEPSFLKENTYRGWTVSGDWTMPLFVRGWVTERCLESAGRLVKDIMRPVVLKLKTVDPLGKAVHLMLAERVDILPVLQDNRVVGMVRDVDVFYEMASLLLNKEYVSSNQRKQMVG
ncbi:MAG: CBS domain-containing protein [Peptococcaceae bacterium]|nr:MAG: CBS domain-containing protein [Peptococcaceae bacterium]